LLEHGDMETLKGGFLSNNKSHYQFLLILLL